VAGKAADIADRPALTALAARLAGARLDLLVQEAVPGPESLVESYHVYVDEQGGIAGEFTGRKLRTYPRSCGFSTAVNSKVPHNALHDARSLRDHVLGLE